MVQPGLLVSSCSRARHYLHPGRLAGREPHGCPHSGCRQTSTAITSQGREKALWVFGSSDSHSSRLEGLLC